MYILTVYLHIIFAAPKCITTPAFQERRGGGYACCLILFFQSAVQAGHLADLLRQLV